ncbi:MAG: HAD family hydrolase [Halanaerobiales bacterium]
MNKIKCIIFDCINTLVDLKKYPEDIGQYASWAFCGSGCEDKWTDSREFEDDFREAKGVLDNEFEEFQEYDYNDRFRFMIDKRFPDLHIEERNIIYQKIVENHWSNYKENCYVEDDIKKLLAELQDRYKLGVVSNFMIKNGVEELLEDNAIIDYFDFIISSINIGWRKPGEIIYHKALEKAKLIKKEILFIGDNYICDYKGPRKVGIRSILLDKHKEYLDIEERVSHLKEIKRFLA